jgi:head-tail adaptor
MTGTLRVRWATASAAITTQHRVLIDDEPYNIRSAENEDRRHRYITMVVEKNVAT